MNHEYPVAQAIAEAEARGAQASAAEVERLRACLETMAGFQDQRAKSARSLGAFNVANTCATFADLIRSGMAPARTSGDGVAQVMAYEDPADSSEFILYGDPDTLRRAAEAEADEQLAWRDQSIEQLQGEVERLKRLASGIRAPCRQCGDAATLCAKSMCCIGCNHSVMAPAPAVTEEQLAADLLREVAFINLDTYPSELRDKLADVQRRIAAALGVKL